MSQTIIRSKITTILANWAAAHSPVIQIVREGQSFPKPDIPTAFIQLFVIPADTLAHSTDARGKRYLGDVHCNIWSPQSEGAGNAEAIAEEIAALFPIVPKTLLPVSIETFPSIKTPIVDDSGYRITPVCFSYRAQF
jgi:hypothetical protein